MKTNAYPFQSLPQSGKILNLDHIILIEPTTSYAHAADACTIYLTGGQILTGEDARHIYILVKGLC
ncbi:MAG: hypothetical protein PW734_02435 [Verrucomicrobium sp.]|nr:hypothetical protein [Verrucomicrobium sp.]